MDDMLFCIVYKYYAKIKGIQALPSCTDSVICTQSLQ